MVPILLGRVQTRLFLLALVGAAVTALITPILPGIDAPPADRYRTTFTILAAVAVGGLRWRPSCCTSAPCGWRSGWSPTARCGCRSCAGASAGDGWYDSGDPPTARARPRRAGR